MINMELAEKKGLSEETIERIEELHAERRAIFKTAENTTRVALLKKMHNMWMDLERELQVLWGFEQDDNYIKFWEFPKCTCAKLDNLEAYPHGYYTVSGDCPIHGGF